jgi:hypothetical protein
MMDGELTLRHNGGDDNQGQYHEETRSSSRGPTELTNVIDSLWDIHLRPNQMCQRAHLS